EISAAEIQLALTEVKAPFDGIVIGKPLSAGELVGTTTDKTAVELCDSSTLLAEIDVPEKRLSKIRIDGPAEIIFDANATQRCAAAVVEIGSRADRSKGTFVVKLKFLETPERLLPDMRVRAN